MQEIINTERLNISFDPNKHRIYCTMQGFWRENTENTKHAKGLFQQLSQQVPLQGTVVIDTTRLRIMHPHTAEVFLQKFTTFLYDKQIRALAHVGDPDNVILKMQFQRVLMVLGKADVVRNKSFFARDEAENWLDTINY